jgi:hypothetical protein
MLNALMKKVKLDKDKNEGIRKIGNVTRASYRRWNSAADRPKKGEGGRPR